MLSKCHHKVVIYVENMAKSQQAKRLALTLKLPIVDHYSDELVLALTSWGLELRLPLKNTKPIYVDFLSKEIARRLMKSRGRHELIARAVGIKGDFLPFVLDATAGFGKDSIVLANLGCKVVMIERSPVIGALLRDGLNRAANKAPELIKNISLHLTDAKKFLQTTNEPIDVIYLDPMFPERVKSSLVRKEMRILKEIVGSDEDAAQLFAIASQYARKRIVVKRPRYAPTITERVPDIVFKARASRFDVYMI